MSIKKLRKEKGFTQITFANALGIARATVAMWETGKSRPRITDFLKIASVLNVPVERVLECFTSETKRQPFQRK